MSIFVSLKTIKTVFNVNYRTEMRENQLCLVHELWITTVLPVFYAAYAFVWVLVHLLTIKPYSLDSVISNNVVGEFKWRLNLTVSLHYFHFTNAISSLFLNCFMVVSSSYNRIIAIHVCYVVVVSVWGVCFYFISSKSIALINGFIYVCVWIFTLSTFIAFLFSLLFSLKVVLFSCLCG